MSDKNLKAIRGQLRQIVKELLTSELVAASQKQVYDMLHKRLDAIDAHIKSQLEEMNERSKETQSYVVRNLALSQVKAATKVEETATTPEV